MIVDDATLKLLRHHDKKKAIEEQLFSQNEMWREMFGMLPQHEREAFMRRKLDNEAFGYWITGVVACDFLERWNVKIDA
jgi:hypothetical protein